MIEPIFLEGVEPTSLWVRQILQDQEPEISTLPVAYILLPQVGCGATTEVPANYLLGPQANVVDQGRAFVPFPKLMSP